jgi:hypothetical protein
MSASELGQLFVDGLAYSPSIFDAKTIIVHEGTYITSIPQTVHYGAARSIDNTGGLRKDEMYWPNAERDRLIPAHWSHRHNTGDHWNGGSYQDIILANGTIMHHNMLGATPEMFYSSVSGSGIVDRHTSGYIRVRTGLTANSYARIFKGGADMSFAAKVFWRARLRCNDDLGQLVRFGCKMEDVQNVADNTEKFGLEGCDGDGPQYRLVTANGIGRHKEPTPFNIEQATTFQGFHMLLEPGTVVTLEYHDGTQVPESNNVPSQGLANDREVIKMGIKTTNSNEKIITVSAAEAFSVSAGVSWRQMAVTT